MAFGLVLGQPKVAAAMVEEAERRMLVRVGIRMVGAVG